MNVSELQALTYWIDEEIREAEIVSKYQQLQSVAQRNTQPNQQKVSLEEQKDNLFEALNAVSLNTLTKDQLTFLEHLGIASAIGSQGVEYVEDLLFRNAIDVANVAQKLSETINKINEGLVKSLKIQEGLYECVSYEKYEEHDEILMRVTFDRDASISSVSDLKEWGTIWYDIGRGIAMANGATPEDVKVIGATKGSIVIELAVAAGIATTASTILLRSLKVAEKVLDILKKVEELRGLKLKNKKLVAELEKEAQKEKEAGIEEITNIAVGECKLDPKKEGDKVAALENAVKKLVSFVEKGGEVDFVMPEDEETDEDEESQPDEKREALSKSFEEIRKLENKLSLLEGRKAQQ